MSDIDDRYPTNSHRVRLSTGQSSEITGGEKKVTQITKGKVLTRKKNFLDKFSETFIGNDTHTVGSYILWDVLIPAAKNTIVEMVKSGIEMLFYGDGKAPGIRRDRGRSYVSYSSMYDRERERDRGRSRPEVVHNRSSHQFDDILIRERVDAEEVLSSLVDMIDQYGVATVADFYDMVGVTSEHTDHKYGWENLSRAVVTRVRNGYILELPKTMPLD